MGQFSSIRINEKSAQAWSLDLVVASMIFLAGIVVLYVYAVNYSSQTKDQLNELFYDGNLASQILLSESESGILSEGKINQTKLDEFFNSDYETKRKSLGLNNDFYFMFDGMEVNGTPVSYIGKINDTEVSSLVRITRLAVYKNTPKKLDFFVWNEK